MNPLLEDTPEIINKDPYVEGWLIKIKVQDSSEIDTLLDHSQYQKMIEA